MKTILLISCFIVIAFSAHAQGTLESIFYNLPDPYILWENYSDKKEKMLEMKKSSDEGNYNASFIDERNGYLRWTSYQCEYELCYWKNYVVDSGDTAKLVAVITGCSNELEFLVEDSGKFTPVSFEVFETFGVSYFFKEGTSAKAMKPYLNYVKFDLPWKGRNIVAYYEGPYGERDGEELLRGDKIDFVWNNGVFEMGEPYF